jgi:hypothetical protein
LTDQPYLDAVKLCEAEGHNAEKGDGLWFNQLAPILHRLGYTLVDITFEGRLAGAKTMQSTAWALRDGKLGDASRILLQTRNHFAAVRDGIIHDWSSAKKMHITSMYRVEVSS